MKLANILLLGLCVQLSLAKFGWGPCSNPSVVEDFDAPGYMGKWLEAARLGVGFETGECVQATYTPMSDGYFSVVNAEYLDTGKWNSVEGKAYCESSGDGHCHVKFPKSPWGQYNVLDTDYNNYSVVYSCANFYIFHISFSWVLEREVGSADLEKYLPYLKSLGFSDGDVHITSHKDCPSFNN